MNADRPSFPMAGRLRWVRIVAAFAALAVGASADDIRLNKPFPPFKHNDAFSNEEISLQQLRGKVVIVDFWASWCPPCVAEVPHLRDTFEKYHAQGLEVVSISLDHNAAAMSVFVSKNRMKWRHIYDEHGVLATRYQIDSIPQMFVIDQAGVVVALDVRGSELEKAVEKALAAGGAKSAASKPAEAAPSANDEALEWLKIARALRTVKDAELARKYYTRVIDKYPDSPLARQAREEREALPKAQSQPARKK